jgi:hypothetical protein
MRFLALLLGLAVTVSQAAFGQCSSTCLPDGKQSSGAIYRICMPQPGCYHNNLVIYAHGYVDAYKPVGIPENQLNLPDGTNVPALINALGFAFATTSYSKNGLSVLEGVRDIRDLVEVFRSRVGAPHRIYVVGPSEGGLVTAKSIETYPNVYAGGLAACGPIGDFRAQINYVGDFRVLFDYFFPGVIPGKATEVPQTVIDNWFTVYEPRMRQAIRQRPQTAAELVKVAKLGILSPSDIETAIVSIAWYAVFGNADAQKQLGGQAFDNIGRWYTGSSNDVLLNIFVQRYAADAAAIASLRQYETTGLLASPLVTLHTTADPVIPYWHDQIYRKKVEATRSASIHSNFPVTRFGHCEFNAVEALIGFGVLLLHSAWQAIAPGSSTTQQFLPTEPFTMLERLAPVQAQASVKLRKR